MNYFETSYEITDQCEKCGRDFLPEENTESLCPDCEYKYAALVPARLVPPQQQLPMKTKTLQDSSGATLSYLFREDGSASRNYKARNTMSPIQSNYPKHRDAILEYEDKIAAGWKELP